MIRINLIPIRVTKKQLQIRQQIVLAAVILVMAIGTVVSMAGSIGSKISKVQQDTLDTQAKLKQLDSTVKKIESFKAQKAELEKKLDVIERLLNNRRSPVHMMAELSVSAPEKLWVNSLANSGNTLEIKGIADTEATVIDFAQKLKGQGHFGDVEIKELQGKDDGKPAGGGTLREFIEFTLMTTVRSTI